MRKQRREASGVGGPSDGHGSPGRQQRPEDRETEPSPPGAPGGGVALRWGVGMGLGGGAHEGQCLYRKQASGANGTR